MSTYGNTGVKDFTGPNALAMQGQEDTAKQSHTANK
jgi:hypothetical protein